MWNRGDAYEKCGFKVLVTPELEDETILMYFDLKQFVDTKE